MCLIAFCWQKHPRYALALIANRDERHDRASRAAAPQPDAPHIIGGLDLQAGGSWMQLSTRGRLAAITNWRTGHLPPSAKRSRGALVTDFVRSAASGSSWARATLSEASDYAPFTLLAWDGSELTQVGNHPAPFAKPIKAGLHALSNAALDAPWPKSLRTLAALSAWLDSSAAQARTPEVEPLFAALADRTEASDETLPSTGVPLIWERRLSAAFISGADYGTRASSVVLIEHAGGLHLEERRFGPQGAAAGTSLWRGRRESAR